ncbi:MAG: hypothetical protein IH598_06400, partial [Bacteroidales bacterium]|nr:hypothetical protein [Bacteroidales bacterium]
MRTTISRFKINSGKGRFVGGLKMITGFAITCLLLAVMLLPVKAQQIVKAEYFFNSDPGNGMGTDIPIASPSNQVENISFTAPVDLLEPGFNRLLVRAKDDAGKWTLTHTRTFYKSAVALDLPDIVEVEYFFNIDPGFGEGVNIPVTTPSTDLKNIEFVADVSCLNPGFNRLMVRAKDETGHWTQTHIRTFYKSAAAFELPDIVEVEYFFNADPGFGSGINIPVVNPSSGLENIDFIADVSNLGPGFNRLILRAKDITGKWTQSHIRTFYKSSIPADLANIVQAEYFINTDPGIGSGINIPVLNPATKLENLEFIADLSGLPLGKHLLFIRSKDVTGKWSITFLDEICKTPFANFTSDLAELGNPTTFTNLTQFADENTGYFWDVDNNGEFDYTGGDNFLHLYP